MNSLLIASFESESSARDAMKKLDEIALNGNVDLYERALIRKTLEGHCDVFRESGSAGWQTITGALAGSLVGLPGGPLTFVIGLIAGAVAGSAVSDREQHQFGEDIRKWVENDIPPGKVAIVAHLGERDPELVNSILNRFGSVPLRADLGNARKKTETGGNS